MLGLWVGAVLVGLVLGGIGNSSIGSVLVLIGLCVVIRHG